MMLEITKTQQIAVWVLPVLFALTFHEAAHAYIANKLGDSTAKMLGRLSLNPIHHIDLVGTIVVPILVLFMSNFSFAFGWAKPVPINPNNFKNQRKGILLSTAAGPIANFIMALLWALCFKLGLYLNPNQSNLGLFLWLSGNVGIMINLLFCFLNLIPIPPLDGGKIVSSLLPYNAAVSYNKLEPYGFFILLALLFLGAINWIISPLISYTFKLISLLFGL